MPLPDYLQKMCVAEPLPALEQSDLARAARAGDKEARDRLVLTSMRLVLDVVRPLSSRTAPIEDLVQAGVVGLLKSIDTYDYKRAKFSTYAYVGIWLHAVREAIGLCYMADQHMNRVVSLDQVVSGDDEGQQVFMHEIVADRDVEDPVDRLDQAEQLASAMAAVSELRPLWRECLVLRFGLSGALPLSLENLARMKGFSTARAGKIVEVAILRVRRILADQAARMPVVDFGDSDGDEDEG